MNFAAFNVRARNGLLREQWPGGEVLRSGGGLLLRNAKVAGRSARPDKPRRSVGGGAA